MILFIIRARELAKPTTPWSLQTTMRSSDQGSLDIVPANIQIIREIDHSDASSVFEIELKGRKCAMKLVSSRGFLLFVCY